MQKSNKFRKLSSFNKKGYFTALGICCAMVGIACFNAYRQTENKIAEQLSSEAGKPAVTADYFSAVEAAEKKSGIRKETSAVTSVTTSVTSVTSAPSVTSAVQPKKSNTVPSVKFVIPVNGEIIQDFSGDELVKNATTGAWQTHNGVDISGAAGDDVKAMTDGTVTEILEDPLWGAVVVIDHGNGLTGRYCGLNKDLRTEKGRSVSAGELIGTVGNTADIESSMDTHLHFEVMKNKKYVDPVDVINNRG